MAFLDNSGDIILDAVLTDTGRMRLAKGDGSFRVAKFALGDDEIDYSLYNGSNPSGTAYYDLEILQTPVLEAFSNNASSMKSKLISIAKNNLFYLPVIKINNLASDFCPAKTLVNNGYVLTVDNDTETFVRTATYDSVALNKGVLFGNSTSTTTSDPIIQTDQGLDTANVTPASSLDIDLVESQYLVEIDNRIASIVDINRSPQTPSYIDDDNIATYYFSKDVDSLVSLNASKADAGTDSQVIAGPRGTVLKLKLSAQLDVSTSDYLFNTIGIDLTTGFGGSTPVRGILTSIRVSGVTTGYSVDIPLMVIKVIN